MAKTSTDWVFSRGITANQNRIFFSTFPNAGSPVDVTQVVRWSSLDLIHFLLPWEVKACTYLEFPELHAVFMGSLGEVRIFSAKGNLDEFVDRTTEGPAEKGVLRDVRTIGRHVYAVGMNRQCYRRECGESPISNGIWRRHDKGVLNQGEPVPIVGFNSIDGFSEKDIYAAGWHGEIWHNDGVEWSQCESVTNLKFERIVCGSDGRVCAVGQAGLIVVGTRDRWKSIDQIETEEQFWGATWFKGAFWVCTREGVYTLESDDILKRVAVSTLKSVTYGWLMSNEDRIWSVGLHHVFFSDDGSNWTQIFF